MLVNFYFLSYQVCSINLDNRLTDKSSIRGSKIWLDQIEY